MVKEAGGRFALSGKEAVAVGTGALTFTEGAPAGLSSCPRIIIAAPASGSGKTMLTCGLMKAFRDRGLAVHGMKCGPDFIDPLFHAKILGVKSRNIDGFLMNREQMRATLYRHGKDADITVMEGVMGYYDGIGGSSVALSTYETAAVTRTPVLLVVDCSGCGVSIVPMIRGLKDYRSDAGIAGVILNNISDGLAEKLAEVILEETDLPVVGSLPKDPALAVGSRHLGLVLPDEIKDIEEKLAGLAGRIAEYFDLDKILEIAGKAPEVRECSSGIAAGLEDAPAKRIADAADEAFCFMYDDNEDALREAGAEIVHFSPLHDEHLPENISGIILPGGYPELYCKALSENVSMRAEIKQAHASGMPLMAECGGFLYLHDSLKDMDGTVWPLVGLLDAEAYYAGKTGRFGYITVMDKETGREVRAHEFHAYESTDPGSACMAVKPVSGRNWKCMHKVNGGLWGFPHLYYPSCPEIVEAFLK